MQRTFLPAHLTLLAVVLASVAVLPAHPEASWAQEEIRPIGTGLSDPFDLAAAMTRQANLIVSLSPASVRWQSAPGVEDAHAISSRSLGRFPRTSEQFAIMTTGSVERIDDPEHFASIDHDAAAPPDRGDSVRDVSVLELDLNIPTGHNCLRFDFAFFSEEYPEFIGSEFNDGFVAEVGQSTWTTEGSTIIAPDNFAHPLDAPGEVVSVNTIGVGWSTAEAAQLAYAGGTVPLTASTPVEPGRQTLYLSIFDQGDGIYDSAAFIEDLRTVTVLEDDQCTSGAAPSIERPLVLLPGIMGSYLGVDGGGVGNRRWPSSGAQILQLALEPDGTTTVDGQNIQVMRGRGANGMIESAYGMIDTYATTVAYLEDRGYVRGQTLFPFGTDWRLAPEINAQRLWLWLEAEGVFDDHESVDIIAHSQGGLVAHDAIAHDDVAGRPGHERVEHLVTIGTPWLGSVDMSSILLYGEPCKIDPPLVPCWYRRDAAAEAIRHMPGALQLLPTDNYPVFDGQWGAIRNRSRVDELTAYRERIGEQGAHLLDEAVTDSTSRYQQRAFERVQTLHLVGSGIPTTYQLEELSYDLCSWYAWWCELPEGVTTPDEDFDSRLHDDLTVGRFTYASGDGTVIETSARMGTADSPALPDVRRAYVRADHVGDDAGHTPMMRSEAVLEYAHQFVTDTLPEPRAAIRRGGPARHPAALTAERAAWLASPERVTRSAQPDPTPAGISDEPAVLEGVALDLRGVGTATIEDEAGNQARIELVSPVGEPQELGHDDPGLLALIASLEALNGISVRIMEGRLSAFISSTSPSANALDPGSVPSPEAPETPATPTVRVHLAPTIAQEIGLEVNSYRGGQLERLRVLPATLIDTEELTLEVTRDPALPDSVQVGDEQVALGPELTTTMLGTLPVSTITRRPSLIGPAQLEVAAAVDGDDEVVAIEWRTDQRPTWQRVSGTEATLRPSDDDEVAWVRAVTRAGLTEAPARRVEVTAGPDRVDVCAQVPPVSFADAHTIAAVHLDNVTCMAAYGITVGVDDAPNFAPGERVTRQQMATFLARLLRVADTGAPGIPGEHPAAFTDVGADNVHAPAIGWLASIGVTDGVTPERFAPEAEVTRQQMASFIARAQRYLGAYDDEDALAIIAGDARPAFPDLDQASAVHRPSIEVLRALEVVEGLADGGFGPGQPVTRQQMAAFVMRTASLLAGLDRWRGEVGPGVPEAPPTAPDPGPQQPAQPSGVDADVAAYRSGAWTADDDADGWQRIAYVGDPDRTVRLQARRLPGWWAAERLVDAFESGEPWFQGFEGVLVGELHDDPRFPDALRAVEIRSTSIATDGGHSLEPGPWATGDDRRYLLDHGDHVVEVVWQSRVASSAWHPFAPGTTVDPDGQQVIDSLSVSASGTALLDEPADPSAEDWSNVTIDVHDLAGATGTVHLVDGTFEGVGPDGSELQLSLIDVGYGDATGTSDLEALLLFASSGPFPRFAAVMTTDGAGSWRQLDVSGVTADTERLVAVNELLFTLAGDDTVTSALFWVPSAEAFVGAG